MSRRTTVEFTPVTEPILASLEAGGFDIRSIVNGALVAFAQLSGDAQKNAISEANGEIARLLEIHDEFARRVLQVLEDAKAIPSKNKGDSKAKGAKSA